MENASKRGENMGLEAAAKAFEMAYHNVDMPDASEVEAAEASKEVWNEGFRDLCAIHLGIKQTVERHVDIPTTPYIWRGSFAGGGHEKKERVSPLLKEALGTRAVTMGEPAWSVSCVAAGIYGRWNGVGRLRGSPLAKFATATP